MPTSRYICSNVIRPHTPRARNCEKSARWQFWDANLPPAPVIYYSCAGCLSPQLSSDADVEFYTVQKIEY